jgi:hypothetical protein
VTNHASLNVFRKANSISMKLPAMVQALMLELYVFRKRYRYPSSANPFSEHDLSFNMLSEASNHVFPAQVIWADMIMLSCSGIKRGVIYARVNGSQKRKIAHNLRGQVELFRGQMKRDSVEEAERPIKDVASGLDFKRKGLKKLLELACAKRVDCVYICSLDRLGRHVFETFHFMYRLRLEGVVVRCIERELNR